MTFAAPRGEKAMGDEPVPLRFDAGVGAGPGSAPLQRPRGGGLLYVLGPGGGSAGGAAARAPPGLPLIAGGKSFGGRMTSSAAATSPLPGVRGLAFLGFPLHPPNRPGSTRAAHL